MRNRSVGFILLGIVVLIGFLTYSFNMALENIINQSCTHGQTCPMWIGVNFQTNISLAVIAVIIVVAGYFIYSDRKGPIKKKTTPANLLPDEKKMYEFIISAGGTIFQSELVEKTNFSKVKVTRLLDSLEGKNLITRRRRGMTNVVILKN